MLKNEPIAVFVFTQVAFTFSDDSFEIYTKKHPVQHYFKHAQHIYTAAGFNLMQELRPYQEKHTAFPIDRMFDDQFFRTQNKMPLQVK